jgi:hypothetical protein
MILNVYIFLIVNFNDEMMKLKTFKESFPLSKQVQYKIQDLLDDSIKFECPNKLEKSMELN